MDALCCISNMAVSASIRSSLHIQSEKIQHKLLPGQAAHNCHDPITQIFYHTYVPIGSTSRSRWHTRSQWHTRPQLYLPAKAMPTWHGSSTALRLDVRQPSLASHSGCHISHKLHPLFCGLCKEGYPLRTLFCNNPHIKGMCTTV